jgi:hypothetical protein
VAERVCRRFPQAKVLLTSGYAGGRGDGRPPPASTLLAKPYSREQLLARIAALFPPPAPEAAA